MKRNLVSIITAALLLVILLLYLVAFQVRESEKAFVTRFGKIDRTQPEAGLYWKWPWPVEKVYRFDGRIRVYEGLLQEAMTQDNRILLVKVAAGWSVADPRQFYQSVGTIRKAEAQLGDYIRNYKCQVVGRHSLSHFVAPNRSDLKFEEMENEIKSALIEQAGLEKQFGIRLPFVRISQLALPKDVTSAVFDRMKAERDQIARKIIAEGEASATKTRAEADKERKNTLARAEADATRLRGEGDSAAAVYYDTFKKDPELTIFLAELEALAKMKHRTTVILDPNSPPFNLLLGAPRPDAARTQTAPGEKKER